jgi:ferredoxin
MSRRGIELKVDRIACDGYGMCAELLPEMIALDDWGYPIVRPGPVPERLLEHARRAVDVCPVLALRLHSMASPGDGRRDHPPGGWNGAPREPAAAGGRAPRRS